MTPPGRDALARRIHAWIDRPAEPWEALALDVHRWQRAHAPVLRAIAPEAEVWTAIPAVPVPLFKDLPVGTVPPTQPGPTFRTSGTTGSGRGVHRLWSTDLYDHGALTWARRCLPHLPDRTANLLSDPADTPDASLSHMVALFAPPERSSWFMADGRLDLEGFARAAHGPEPVFVGATAFALAEALSSPLPPLPPGSVVMVTGGFKGRTIHLSDEQLYHLAVTRLRPARLVTEYGMTELSSQLWGEPGQPYRPPPWMRVLAVDPTTGATLPAGATGLLRFFDLANLDSSLAIETLDLGEVHPSGAVTLHGRLPGAEARGCSLTIEEAWDL